MELQDFITKTLVQIQQGVSEAQKQLIGLQEKGAINPVWGTATDVGHNHIQSVDFDVAITVTEQKETGGGASLNVMGVRAGGERIASSEDSSVSRVKFSIPFIPPVQLIEDRYE